MNLVEVLLREARVLLLGQLHHVIRVDDGGEDGEALLRVERRVVVVDVRPGHLDLLSRPRAVDEVRRDDDLLRPRDAPCGDGAGRLLERHFLKVAVHLISSKMLGGASQIVSTIRVKCNGTYKTTHRLLVIQGERAVALALGARAELRLHVAVVAGVLELRKGAEDVPALLAVEPKSRQLREFAGPPRHDAGHFHQAVQVVLPERAQRVRER